MDVSCSGRLAAAFTASAIHMAVTVGLARWEPYAQLDDLRVQTMEWVVLTLVKILKLYMALHCYRYKKYGARKKLIYSATNVNNRFSLICVHTNIISV